MRMRRRLFPERVLRETLRAHTIGPRAIPQILYQIMNTITLYAVVLSEVMNRAGPSVVMDYASFFNGASYFIIAIMLVYVWYFDIWASALLQERVFQPALRTLKPLALAAVGRR